MTLAMYESALNWLGKGFYLLPIQPGTKKQVRGFGLHQKRITNMQEASQWFNDHSRFNLAVIAPEGKFIFDFDDWSLYLSWLRFVKKFCDAVTTSYTEITPNDGAHVFLSGQLPNKIQLVEHVEIKRAVLVAPSIVDNFEYEIISDGKIYSGSLDAALFPLSKSPSAFAPDAIRRFAARVVSLPIRNPRSKLESIKLKISILDLMNEHFPKIILRGHGRFLTACCPFHKESEPSFWIDTERNLFGCHACKVHGDVINFFAQITGKTNNEAIEDLFLSIKKNGGVK
jgi:hypothetical protein